MKWFLALCGVLLGLVLTGILYLALFRYVWMESGCWRWDPEPSWAPPSNCGFLGGLLKLVSAVALGSAILVPLFLANRRKR